MHNCGYAKKSINKHTCSVKESDMLAEYDFTGGEPVNEALRVITKLAGKQVKKSAA